MLALYLEKENGCSHAIHHNSVVIHSLSINQLLIRVECMPAILDSFVTGVVNSISTPTFTGGGDWKQ